MKRHSNTFYKVFAFIRKYLVLLLISSTAYATTEEIAIPCLVVLSQIPTQASIDEVLALAQEGSTNQMRQQFVFAALVQIGPSNSAYQYAKKSWKTLHHPLV